MISTSHSSQHEIEIYDLTSEHSPKVELIQTIENPRNTHLALALENLWLACRPGFCNQSTPEGHTARRRAVSSIIHAWCAMESAVNLALFYKLRHPECGYYLTPIKRKSHDKRISDNLNSSLSFKDRLLYLADAHDCCNTINEQIGKVQQFEKLRNALVHGYSIRKDMLLEEVVGSTVRMLDAENKSFETTTFIVGHEELVLPKGKKYSFKELGLQHDITKLCRHDADRCVQVAVNILRWLDIHYGIQTSAGWHAHGKDYKYYSRLQEHRIPDSPKPFIGLKMLWDGYRLKDQEEKRRAHIAKQKRPPKPGFRQGKKPKRKKK